MKQYRDCGSEIFNTGSSKCPFSPEFIETIVLTPSTMVIKKADLETKIGEMAHADRPDRVYPIISIAEYTASGGEAQTSKEGYGASKISSYSELIETWTLANFDMGVRNNLLSLKSEVMRALYIDREGRVYCENVDNDNIRGFELSSIYPSGNAYKSSGESAKTMVNMVYKDVERAWKNSDIILCDRTILDEAKGLVWVKVEKVGSSGNNYKVIEYYAGFDLTEMYGSLLGSSEVWENATAVTYEPGESVLTITVESGAQPKLKRPSELYEKGIKGIEQWS